MSVFYLLLVAIVQGITEFLPISSSGHLIVLPELLGQPDQGVAIDVAVHVGTLAAVILFFRTEVARALSGTFQVVRGQTDTGEARLALALIVATIPAVLVGGVLAVTGANDLMRGAQVVGWAMIVFGVVLYAADKLCPAVRPASDWTIRHAIWMGLAQCVALIPGTSRAGITITAARALGYTRKDGATISMLMSIPIILASGGVLALDVVGQADWALAGQAAIAAVFAAIAALFALSVMFRFLNAVSFTPYIVYRIVFGVGLLVWAGSA
ncbi:MAG: undecaprenyl-diphosphate phosphatase [Rhodobacteraceae bacterium]|nr:undecaprenyl-diphosphate phosphatase [Paracoccaceae bacterium]